MDPIEKAADRRRNERISVLIAALAGDDTESVKTVLEETKHDFGGMDALALALARRAVLIASHASMSCPEGPSRDQLLQDVAAKEAARYELE